MRLLKQAFLVKSRRLCFFYESYVLRNNTFRVRNHILRGFFSMFKDIVVGTRVAI